MSAEQISDAKHMAQEICELLHGAPDEGCPHYASDVQDVEQYLLKRLSAHPDTGKEDGERLQDADIGLLKQALRLARLHIIGEALPTKKDVLSIIDSALDSAQSAPNEGRNGS
jgi:hypothetical protein